jgi:hypothetical protein
MEQEVEDFRRDVDRRAVTGEAICRAVDGVVTEAVG